MKLKRWPICANYFSGTFKSITNNTTFECGVNNKTVEVHRQNENDFLWEEIIGDWNKNFPGLKFWVYSRFVVLCTNIGNTALKTEVYA